MKIDKYDLSLGEKIQKLGKYEDISIWSRFHNKLDCLWGRNYKDKIKIETYMKIPIQYYGEEYGSNFMFDITPKQAKEIIETLQKILKNRKKLKK